MIIQGSHGDDDIPWAEGGYTCEWWVGMEFITEYLTILLRLLERTPASVLNSLTHHSRPPEKQSGSQRVGWGVLAVPARFSQCWYGDDNRAICWSAYRTLPHSSACLNPLILTHQSAQNAELSLTLGWTAAAYIEQVHFGERAQLVLKIEGKIINKENHNLVHRLKQSIDIQHDSHVWDVEFIRIN